MFSKNMHFNYGIGSTKLAVLKSYWVLLQQFFYILIFDQGWSMRATQLSFLGLMVRENFFLMEILMMFYKHILKIFQSKSKNCGQKQLI